MGTPSNPGWATGYVPSAAEWAAAWQSKADYPVPVGQGGTGLTTTPTAGALLIGTGSGFTISTLSSGPGIVIDSESGAITISSTIFPENLFPPTGIPVSTGTGWGPTSYAVTGTGNVVLSASPTLTNPTFVTPNIGVASGTSLSISTGQVEAAPSGATDIVNKAYCDSSSVSTISGASVLLSPNIRYSLKTSAGNLAPVLPALSAMQVGWTIEIQDIDFQAYTNNQVIRTSGSDTIIYQDLTAASNFVMNQNGVCLRFVANETYWRVIYYGD